MSLPLVIFLFGPAMVFVGFCLLCGVAVIAMTLYEWIFEPQIRPECRRRRWRS